jgi:hypothetical protein
MVGTSSTKATLLRQFDKGKLIITINRVHRGHVLRSLEALFLIIVCALSTSHDDEQ